MKKLDKIFQQIAEHKTPPVHLWNPEQLGEIDIHIDSMGCWSHEGGQINRAELVRLFASILWCEHDEYFLITPVEKLKIRVDDVPFLVQTMELIDDHWVATLNTNETIVINANHPVQLREYQGNLIPYIRVRYNLWARVNRSVYYQWVTEALHDNDDGQVVLMSGDYVIQLGVA